MTYSSVSCANKNEVIAALKSFAESNGWTTNYYAADGAGYRLHINKDSVYGHFSTNYDTGNSQMSAYVSEAFTGSGTAWNLQGAVRSAIQSSMWGVYTTYPVTVHFFSHNAPTFLGMVVVAPGRVMTTLLGNVTKIGAYSGGQFFGAYTPLYYHNYTSAGDALTVGSTVSGIQINNNGAWGYSYQKLIGIPAIDTVIGNAPLFPVNIGASSNGRLKPLGNIPWCRTLAGKLYVNEDEIIYGADTWKYFDLQVIPDAHAFAIKK